MAEGFRDRLRRLRKEAPAPVPEAPGGADPQEMAPSGSSSRSPLPGSSTSGSSPLDPGPPAEGASPERLARLRARLARRAAEPTPASDGATPAGRTPGRSGSGVARQTPVVAAPPCPKEPGTPRDLTAAEGPDGAPHVARVEHLTPDARHGDWTLEEVRGLDPDWVARLAADPTLADLDPTRAVYLDTETTGLSGGAGTWVYLVGLGRFTASGRFELWQGFLRGPEDEGALLAEVARRVRAASCVVSFFGKSFDRHRLEDKMRLCGVEPPFGERPHLDLYHPLRRVTRGAYPDGRLNTLERALCGVERVDDLSGAHAPEAWFDFLADRPHRLEGVFRHNRDDVLSLVTLAGWLGRCAEERRLDGRDLAGPGHERARGLARVLREAGDLEAALEWTERALERAPGDPAADGAGLRRLQFERGELLRRLRRVEPAEEALAAFVTGAADRWTVPALEARAKLREHDLDDVPGALELVRTALALVPGLLSEAEARRARAALEHRRARLEGKLGRRRDGA